MSVPSGRRPSPAPTGEGDPGEGRGPGESRRRLRWVVVPVLAPLVVFADALALRRLLAPGDGANILFPLHVLAARIWAAGDVPGWNPYSFSGSALLASAQAGVFYPPNLVFVVLSPALANNVGVILSFVIAGAGAHLLTRRLCGDDVGAAVAGLSFAFSGFMFAHVGHQNMIASLAWLPWAVLGYDLLCRRISALRLLLAGGALAMVLVAGHPQMFSIALAALGAYGVALGLVDLRVSRGRPVLALVLLVAVALALSAVQLLPTIAILGATDRSVVSFDAATTFSFPGSHLALLVFPYLFGNAIPAEPFAAAYQGRWNLTELAGYPGAAALCLAAAGLGAARRDRRVVAVVVMAVIALLVALGSLTVVGTWVYRLPVYGQFRSWGRFAAVADLAVAVLAGYGVARLRGADAKERWAASRAAAAAAGLVAVAAVVLPRLGAIEPFVVEGTARTAALVLPTAFAAAAAGTALVLAVARHRSRLAAALCLVVLADAVGSFGAFYEWRTASPSVAAMTAELDPGEPATWGEVPDAPGGIDRFVVGSADLAEIGSYLNVTAAKQLRSVNGFEPLAPNDYLRAVGGMHYFGGLGRPDDLWRPGSDLLDLLRVSLVVVVDDSSGPLPDDTSILTGGVPVGDTGVTRYERRPALPDAFLVGAATPMAAEEVVDALRGTIELDPAAVALVEEPCPACSAMTRPGPAGSAVAERQGTQRIDVDARAERSALLVVSEAWFPGWHATVDGEEVPVLRVDGMLVGVPLGPGDHHVELRYRAPGLAAGAVIAGATAAGLIGAALVSRRRRGRRAVPALSAAAPPTPPDAPEPEERGWTRWRPPG